MTIRFSKRFRKQFQKLKSGEQDRFWDRLELFKRDQHSPQLSNHALKGIHQGLHSINIGGDLRALYIEKDGQIFIFELIGTHSQLYGK